jgi:hypothetical protein
LKDWREGKICGWDDCWAGGGRSAVLGPNVV